MKLVLAGVNETICIKKDKVNTVVIENPSLMYSAIRDLKQQLNKLDGKSILSVNNSVVEIYKTVEMLTDAYEMNLNSKTLLTKIIDDLCKKAVNEDNYERTMNLLSYIYSYMEDMLWDMDSDIQCGEVQIKQLLKALDIIVVDDIEDLPDRMYRYLTLVRQYLGEKLFIFVNFRGYIEEERFKLLINSLLEHEFNCLFIDNKSYNCLENENRLTIDIDLCEF